MWEWFEGEDIPQLEDDEEWGWDAQDTEVC